MARPEWGTGGADDFLILDMRYAAEAAAACRGVDEVYALAADMGGMGYLSCHHAGVLRDNALMNIQTIEAARQAGVGRYFFASSACVYPEGRQATTDAPPLAEHEAYPADPQDAYGWEKLISERLCGYYTAEYGFDTRVARFHAIYGPEGTWRGGREKAPAALCRKVAEAPDGGEIEVWGDGLQTRSFCYIDDLVDGIHRLMHATPDGPVNIGRVEMVAIDALAETIIALSGKSLTIRHVPGPQGVRGRNSDNSLCRQVLGWEPSTTLAEGLARTYEWVAAQVAR